MTDATCKVCGEEFPDDYGKFDSRAPVFADEFVYHRECEAEVIKQVYAEVP